MVFVFDFELNLSFRTSEDAQKFQTWIRAELDIKIDIYDLPDDEKWLEMMGEPTEETKERIKKVLAVINC